MPTGNGKKVKASKAPHISATGLRFERGRLVVRLIDDREVSVPLSRYPTLHRASPVERSRWRLIGGGQGFHWPDLDLDLSTAGLTSGLAEFIPRPPGLSASEPKAARRRSA